MNNSYVTDTMAMVLRLEKRRLPGKVKSIFADAEQGRTKIFIPAIALAEIGYLSERKRIETDLQAVKDYCRKYPSIQVESLTEEVIQRSFGIDDIPELYSFQLKLRLF